MAATKRFLRSRGKRGQPWVQSAPRFSRSGVACRGGRANAPQSQGHLSPSVWKWIPLQSLRGHTRQTHPAVLEPDIRGTAGVCLSGGGTNRGSYPDVCVRPTDAGVSLAPLIAFIPSERATDTALGTFFIGQALLDGAS